MPTFSSEQQPGQAITSGFNPATGAAFYDGAGLAEVYLDLARVVVADLEHAEAIADHAERNRAIALARLTLQGLVETVHLQGRQVSLGVSQTEIFMKGAGAILDLADPHGVTVTSPYTLGWDELSVRSDVPS